MFKYLKKIISSASKESSKRFIAIWSMILVSIVTIWACVATREYNTIIITLLTFVGSLVGISTWENIRNISNNKEKKEE